MSAERRAGDWYVDALSSVRIVAADIDHIDRALTDEWAADYYRFRDREDVLKHLAYNCAVNGTEDASRLDGWADLPEGALTMKHEPMVEVERVFENDTAEAGSRHG